jgi:hypothetical protein
MAHNKEAKKALDPSWQPIAVGSPESSGKQWKDPARRGIVRKSLESGTQKLRLTAHAYMYQSLQLLLLLLLLNSSFLNSHNLSKFDLPTLLG